MQLAENPAGKNKLCFIQLKTSVFWAFVRQNGACGLVHIFKELKCKILYYTKIYTKFLYYTKIIFLNLYYTKFYTKFLYYTKFLFLNL